MRRIAILLGSILLALLAWRTLRPGPAPAQLHGLWGVSQPRGIADELRFYYFHTGGKGLYRYGQVGHNQTHSFDWKLDGDRLVLDFRKTGEHAKTRIELTERAGERSLTLLDDPRGPGPVRYVHRPSNLAADEQALGGPLSLSDGDKAAGEAAMLKGRIWIDVQRYATGGLGFVMYQLSAHPLGDGQWLGWYHRGDFDDWTTETLAYREEPQRLRLRFLLHGQEATTPYRLRQEREQRVLTLSRDPRNFLHQRQLLDGGASF